MTTDNFIRNRFAWLDQVGADHDCQGALAFRVAYSLARHLNRATGDAFPGQDRIARECGVTKTAARNAIGRLVKNGHLSVTPGNGRGFSNHYRPILKSAEERCNVDCALSFQKVQPELHDKASKGATVVPLFAEKVQPGCPEGATVVATNPLKNSIEEDISRTLNRTRPQEPSPSRATEEDKHFDEFWHTFPRKIDKAPARRAYKAALKKASPETILAGARRYADERKGQDEKFTRYGATWLNKESWANYQPDAISPAAVPDSATWPRSKFETAVMLAKKNGFWSEAYGPASRIPSDLIDSELQAILTRPPKPFSQVVA